MASILVGGCVSNGVLFPRSVMYYYLELLQQRRICNAATNNDGRSQTMVDLHEVSVECYLC